MDNTSIFKNRKTQVNVLEKTYNYNILLPYLQQLNPIAAIYFSTKSRMIVCNPDKILVI